MAKVRVVLNSAGVRALLKSKELAAECERQARKKKSELGRGYNIESFTAPTRVVYRVYTDDPQAIADNLQNNTMLKTMGNSARTGKPADQRGGSAGTARRGWRRHPRQRGRRQVIT